MLAYGEPFFAMLRGHDLMAVPSLSDEQPRVIFDGFAQALPVIASDTPGIVECVTDGAGRQDRPGRRRPGPGRRDRVGRRRHRDRLRDFGDQRPRRGRVADPRPDARPAGRLIIEASALDGPRAMSPA